MGGGYLYMKKSDSLDITLPIKDNKVSNVKPVLVTNDAPPGAAQNKPPIVEADLSNQVVEKF